MHIEVRDCPRINGKQDKTQFGTTPPISLTSDLMLPLEASGSAYCTTCPGPFKGCS